MRVIGITGGVGSGKSQILKLLENRYGAFVIMTDLVAKDLMEPGQDGYREVINSLGTGFLNKDRTINRSELSRLIFQNEQALNTLNRIIHPMVWAEVRRRIAQAGSSAVIVESAVHEKEQDDICDEIWYVYTSKENRINRLIQSRGYSREKTLSMMKNQPSEEEFLKWCSHIINNNGTIEETVKQLESLWKENEK